MEAHDGNASFPQHCQRPSNTVKVNKKKRNIDPEAVKRNQEENYTKIITALDEKFLKSDPSVLSELETENEELKSRIEKLKEEKASKIAYLKKNVKELESKIETVQQEYAEYKREFEVEKKRLQETIRQQDVESHRMHIKFAMEIKSWRGKLNQLEEFKRMHKAINQKYLDKEEEMKRMEEKYKTDLRTLEEKFTKENERLKAEIVPKVVQLALDLEKANFTDIPIHVRRILRENYAINVKLDQFTDTWQNMKDETDSAGNSIDSAKWEINQSNIQIKTILGQNLILKDVFKKLKREYKKLKIEFYDGEKEREHCRVMTKMLRCVEKELQNCSLQKATLMQQLHAHKITEAEHSTDLHNMKATCITLEEMFRATNLLFEELFREQQEGTVEHGETSISYKFDEQFIQKLDEIFVSAEMWEEIRSAERKPQIRIRNWFPPSYDKKENTVYISFLEDDRRPSAVCSSHEASTLSSHTLIASRFSDARSTVTHMSKYRHGTPSYVPSNFKLLSTHTKIFPNITVSATEASAVKDDSQSPHSESTDNYDKKENSQQYTKESSDLTVQESAETVTSRQTTDILHMPESEEYKTEQKSSSANSDDDKLSSKTS